MKAPTSIDLSPEAVEYLKERIRMSKIDPKTYELILGMIEPSPSSDGSDSTVLKKVDNTRPTAPSKSKKRKGHGRNPASHYIGAAVEKITHPTYQTGDLCPNDCGGKLYLTKPGQFIRVQGGALISATKYDIEKLRCNLCNEIFSSQIVKADKYDARAIAIITVSRYQMGTPMYRLARFQEMMGVPLPEGTQWGLILKAFSVAEIIFKALVKAAAQVDSFFIDDTWVRILDIIRHNKQQTERKNKKGTHTSGILALQGTRKIYLYFSGTQHASQNLRDILEKRETNKIPIQMGDALSRNKVKNFETIECHCIEHGKRKFTEIKDYSPDQCQIVIAAIRQVYHFEQVCLNSLH